MTACECYSDPDFGTHKCGPCLRAEKFKEIRSLLLDLAAKTFWPQDPTVELARIQSLLREVE